MLGSEISGDDVSTYDLRQNKLITLIEFLFMTKGVFMTTLELCNTMKKRQTFFSNSTKQH